MFKVRKLIVIAAIALGIAVSFSVMLKRIYVAPIIMYHSVSPKQNPAISGLIVSPETFQRQMRFLKECKYNILPLDELAALLKEKKRLPPRTIAITFDDGYKDNYTYAFPILRKYNIPVTMFIIINEVGRPKGDRVSWDDIRQMRSSGLITFGSHAMGPQPLINIKSDQELRLQIFDSKKALEDKLGIECSLFSYPEGMFNAKIRQLVVDAGYKAALGTRLGKDYPDNDIFAIRRLRISENAASLFVFWFETSGYYTFFKERRRK